MSETIKESLSASGNGSAAEVNSALRCLQGWIAKRDLNAQYANVSMHVVHADVCSSLLESIYPMILPLLANEETCVAACSCIEDILLDMAFATPSRANPILDFVASDQVGSILERAQEGRLMIVKKTNGADSGGTDQDVEGIPLALFKLLVAVFEHSYTVIIAELQTQRTIALLRRLLLLTCFPGFHASDEQVSDLGLPIWSYVQEEISDNGIVATASGFGDARWATVKEVFEALVRGLQVKAQYPEDDEFVTWPKGCPLCFTASSVADRDAIFRY